MGLRVLQEPCLTHRYLPSNQAKPLEQLLSIRGCHELVLLYFESFVVCPHFLYVLRGVENVGFYY